MPSSCPQPWPTFFSESLIHRNQSLRSRIDIGVNVRLACGTVLVEYTTVAATATLAPATPASSAATATFAVD